ncbi:hypothetical protein LJC45_03115 [Alistipes sp. OttesenSCG-928-B03]|nr:hypothetical protein [Alistipes sp. OttesenSCG-928-B03]
MDESDVLFTFNNHRYIAKFDDSDTEFCILLVFMEFENMNREYCEYITATLNGNIKLIQTEIVDEGVIGRIEFYADSLGYFTHNINRFIDIIDYTFGVITEEYRTISEKERISAAIKKNKGTSSSKPIN